MKYTYAYKTPDGQRHEASMEAPSREVVFAELRQQGIKAIKVVAADASKANGEVRGVRKRIVALVVVSLLLASAIAVIFSFRAGEHSNIQTFSNSNISLTAPRHQIYGDPVIVEAFERGHFDPYLTNRLDQLLAWFAQPGKLMCPKGTDPRRSVSEFEQTMAPACSSGTDPVSDEGQTFIRHMSRNPSGTDPRRATVGGDVLGAPHSPSDRPSGTDPRFDASSFAHELSVLIKSENPSPVQFSVLGKSENFSLITETDPREVCELKQIVNGLREELAAYLANGNGTPRSYWRRLLQRTSQEAQIHERTRRELEHETNPAIFEQKNQALRNLGLRTIPNPKDGE